MKSRNRVFNKVVIVLLTITMLCGICPSMTWANTFNEAELVIAGSGIGSYLEYGEKEHWYYFDTGSASEYYYIEVQNNSVSKSCSVYLKSDSSKTVTYATVRAGYEKTTTPKLLDANTRYYVKVYGTPSKTEDVNYSFNVLCVTDDAGNTPETALSIQTDTYVAGAHEVDRDVDYFSFYTSIAGTYEFEVTNNTGKSKSFAIYDEYNKNVGSMSVPAGTTKLYNNKVLNANSLYYIKIYSGEVGDYSFRIITPTDDCGNTVNEAGLLVLGEKQSGIIDYKNDVDYWTFTTGSQTDYKITVQNSGSHSINVKLYDESNVKQQFQYSSIGRNKKNETHLTLQPDSTYYIEMKSSYAGDKYSIKVEAEEDDYTDEWTEAGSIKTQKDYKGVITNVSDSDWLKFTPSKTSKYYFSRKGSGSRFELYKMEDGDLKKIATCSTGKTVTISKNETYYIRLYTTNKWRSYKYTFSVAKK